MGFCPVCSGPTKVFVRRNRLPALNNLTYATREAARSAPAGRFALATCQSCGFSHNEEFQSELVIYDENYDNYVESPVFNAYYRDLAQLIRKRFELENGIVYEIGCGSGEFLKILCAAVPSASGVGIDPSCQDTQEGNFRLINGTLENVDVDRDARLVILRHVLEHIDDPVAFLETLHQVFPRAPFFIEVPDFDWTLANGVFWDLTYEHCNYFTLPTMCFALRSAGFNVVEQQRSFGGQYQWAICDPTTRSVPPNRDANSDLAAVEAYSELEVARFETVCSLFEGTDHFVLWGMSGKGAILAALLPEGQVAGGIDMNIAKQGRYAPMSGVQIHPPEWLNSLGATTALVMNPNYLDEIGNLIQRLDIQVDLITA